MKNYWVSKDGKSWHIWNGSVYDVAIWKSLGYIVKPYN